jgi:hypothetical protein
MNMSYTAQGKSGTGSGMHAILRTVWRGGVASSTSWVLLNFQLAPAPNPISRATVVVETSQW